jgi:succinate dehydrogenase subunit C
MSARMETRLWLAQRASAAVLALCVVVHLATMIVAVRGGLTASDILGRTHGSVGWGTFYAVFVVAVSVHAPLGLRTIAGEWLGFRSRGADLVFALFAAALLGLGAFAIAGVTR